jgi:nucleotide-binding universal stress UspA family protein
VTRLFRRILVPHDFSEDANRALAVAADLAAAHRGRLTVLHAIVPFYPVAGFPPAEELAWVPPPNLEDDTRVKLQALVRRILGRRKVTCECRVVIAEAYQAILDAAGRADSIVMATVGRSGLSHLLIGSVAEKVVRHAPVPVLTIRSGTGSGRGAARARRAAPAPRRARRRRA